VADSNRSYTGAADLDFKSILKSLDGVGYPGWVYGEFLPQPDAETAARKSIAYLRKI
jgi:sugar phosphate isomerase/epimerase